MKKLIYFALAVLLIIPVSASAMEYVEDYVEPESGKMTVKAVTWLPDVETQGENKLLKAKVDFHYEGDLITLSYDYNFDITCRVNPQRRRGGRKVLFEETRDLTILDDMEIEGPHDFSVELTFTFFPHEFSAAKRRGVICDMGGYGGGKGGSGVLYSIFEKGIKTYNIRLKPKGDKWVLSK